jgi:hypothetical protein
MESNSSTPSRTFITPLCRPDLFDPGQTFPREELLRRVLSVFWRNCCGVPGLARAPAPVVEIAADGAADAAERYRRRAWWVLYDGIIEESEGPNSERISLFFGRGGQTGQLWPRYEFQVLEKPLAVEMNFFQDPGLGWGTRVALELRADGSVHVHSEVAL